MNNIIDDSKNCKFYSYISKLIDLLLPHQRKHKLSTREILKHALFVLQTGTSWRVLDKLHLPCSSSTIYKTFDKWSKLGILAKIWSEITKAYISKSLRNDKYAFQNIYIDSTMIRNIQGKDLIGRNYQDKYKFGTKISVICDKKHIPLSIGFYPANIHDSTTIEKTLEDIPAPITLNKRFKTNLIADKGYRSKYKKDELKFCQVNLIANHRSNEKIKNSKKELKLLAVRHKIENTFCRFKQFKRLTLRYDRNISTYISFSFLSLIWITFPHVQHYVIA